MPDIELDTFKIHINLTEYAVTRGYRILRNETSRNSVAMKNTSTNDKIIITRDTDDHWVYFTVGKQKDNGSIVDFVQNKEGGGNLGRVRQILRQWAKLPTHERPRSNLFMARIEKCTRDRQALIKILVGLQVAEKHDYLTRRAIGKEILTDTRFIGRIYGNSQGAAVFPYEDEYGLCGLEQCNRNFKGFVPGSIKGLWRSNTVQTDTHLVFCESVIDALSYHVLYPHQKTRYMACGGGWSQKTRQLLGKATEKHPGQSVVLAFDRDPQGMVYEAEAKNLLSDFPNIEVIVKYPAFGKDWNEELQAIARRMNLEPVTN